VTLNARKIRTGAAALALLTLGAAGAMADPTPAAIDAARTIVTNSGMSRAIDAVLPQMLSDFERNIAATRPEIRPQLHEVILAIAPEFGRTEGDILNGAALALANHMSEPELKDTAAFFASLSGKKYVETEPLVFKDVATIVQGWRQTLSTAIVTRAREEMKKKGLDF